MCFCRVKQFNVVVRRLTALLFLLKTIHNFSSNYSATFQKLAHTHTFIGMPVTVVEQRLYVCMHTSNILRAMTPPDSHTCHSVDRRELN